MIADVAGMGVLVTGGASGYGRAIAGRLAAEGAFVTIADIAPHGADVATSMHGEHPVVYLECDVSDPVMVSAAVEQARARSGRLDVMVNNAGILGGGWIHDDDADHFLQRQLSVNLVGVWNGCRSALAVMRGQRGGVIINMASPAAAVPTPASVAYGLVKAAVVHLTKSLAVGYGREGVRVNAILPGPAITGIFGLDESAAQDLRTAYARRTPLGRTAETDDVARAIQFLVSSDAGFVSGAVLNVDGAFCAAVLPEDRGL